MSRGDAQNPLDEEGMLEATMSRDAGYLTAAYECGFESASGFRDAFFKEYGVTPGSLAGGPVDGEKR
jgi:AraC-like DNA-binding protein